MSLRVKRELNRKEAMETYLIDLETMNYEAAHQFQLDCVQWRLLDKNRPDIFILVEHPPVFTLGKRGGRESLTVAEEFITSRGVDIIQTERGGDITYHGPGQLVVYPIVHLHQAGLSVKNYVALLEEAMILAAADFSVTAQRDARNRGIWVGDNKIGSIGIRVRHGVCFHGLALNVNLDFEHFNWIQPCGLSGVGVTSITRETGKKILLSAVKARMIEQLARLFNRQFSAVKSTHIIGDAA